MHTFYYIFVWLAAALFAPRTSGPQVSQPMPQYVRYTPDSCLVVLTDVVPDVILEIRYFSSYNFTGHPIPGYEQPIALISLPAAKALKSVSDELMQKGYRLKIYDAYRPQQAVDFFVSWAGDTSDQLTKSSFYPEIPKSSILNRYVAPRSGHTRGSTVDLTLFDIANSQDADMGAPFDYFGQASWPSLLPGTKAGRHTPITEDQYRNRMLLRETMVSHGFLPDKGEWWHFRLAHEPYPFTYFRWPVAIPE